ncbi:hypothetical protein A9Q81_05420 [Gammaproteobacteria bacterium 42_54_T18]|nr:hypothetical protein A9Q81_05420 [Gammaproteobacteria bacterium 42_54_T18]
MALSFHRSHIAVSIICPIIPANVSPLIKYLEALNHSLHSHPTQEHPLFHKINTHHFCRWTVLPASTGKQGTYPAQLLFESNIDGPLDLYLELLIQQDRDTLTTIYQHCEGFNASSIKRYLSEHNIAAPVHYRGAHFHSQQQIQDDQALYIELECFINEKHNNGSLINYFERGLKEQLSKHLKENGINWPFETSQKQPKSHWPTLLGGIALLPFIALPLGVFISVWYITLRKHEKSDIPEIHNDNMAARHNHIRHVTQEEQQATQSPMTSIVEIKPGRFRLITLKVVLWAINLLADIFYNKGKLGSINTIHFARWLIIDNNKRLVFLSNYDGSWENYLGDFIDRAAMGLTAIWGNTEGFPAAKRLLLQGAKNDIAFKAFARKSQLKTHCWYSAYPQLTLQNVLNNSRIRQGFNKPMNEKQLSKWLTEF